MWAALRVCVHTYCSSRVIPRPHPAAPAPHPLLTPTPQVAGAISSLFILIIIVKLGELFQDLPKVSPCTCPASFEGLGQARGSNQSVRFQVRGRGASSWPVLQG